MNRESIEAVSAAIDAYKEDIKQFLVELVQIQSFDNHEEDAVQRVRQEMERLDYDEITIDPMGNIIGRVGSGKQVIAFDGHLDVVDVGDISQWDFPPFAAIEKAGRIWGRGTADQKSGVVCMIYAVAVMKQLQMLDDLTILVTGSVNEEDCDGMCWQYLINETGLKPEFAVLTEPSDGNIYRGQKGRMCIQIKTKGISAHGSVPEQGKNAIYLMAPIISDIEKLNERITYHKQLGKGP